MSTGGLHEAWSQSFKADGLRKVLMEPEVNLQRLKGFIFGRKDVWQPIIYMIYMTKIIFFTTLFGLFFLPVRSKIFRIFKASAQAFTWLQETFWRFWLHFPFFAWSDLHFFSRKNRMTFKTQGSGSFFFLHILFLPLSLLFSATLRWKFLKIWTP